MSDSATESSWDVPEQAPITYHYCSLNTLLSIVKNRQLWLSDMMHSNDSEEISYGFSEIRKMLENEISSILEKKHFPGGKEEIDSATAQILTAFLHKMHSIAAPTEIRCYATCFSTKKDLLSQWRSYGDDGKGVSIGFNLDKLYGFNHLKAKIRATPDSYPEKPHIKPDTTLLDKSGSLDYLPVSYGARGIIGSMIRSMFADISFIFDYINTQSVESLPDWLSIEYQLNLDMMGMLPRGGAFCKMPFFSEEKEWRLAIWAATAESVDMTDQRQKLTQNLPALYPDIISSLEFDMLVRDDSLIPILKLGMNLPAVMEEVVLGPKCRVSEPLMKELLLSRGLPDVKVSTSEGTYR